MSGSPRGRSLCAGGTRSNCPMRWFGRRRRIAPCFSSPAIARIFQRAIRASVFPTLVEAENIESIYKMCRTGSEVDTRFRHPDADFSGASPSIISDYRWGWGLGGFGWESGAKRGGFRGFWGGWLGIRAGNRTLGGRRARPFSGRPPCPLFKERGQL